MQDHISLLFVWRKQVDVCSFEKQARGNGKEGSLLIFCYVSKN